MSGRPSIRTRLNVATMRLLGLPPRDRKRVLAGYTLAGAVYGLAMWMCTHGKDGQFCHTWGPGVVVISITLALLTYIWHSWRKETLRWSVRNGTARLDDRYEELCEKWWDDK